MLFACVSLLTLISCAGIKHDCEPVLAKSLLSHLDRMRDARGARDAHDPNDPQFGGDAALAQQAYTNIENELQAYVDRKFSMLLACSLLTNRV